MLYLILSLFAGILLGALFFGGLWWTVQKMSGSGSPHLLMAVSFIVRTVVVLGAFYLLVQTGWPNLLAAMLGFIVARIYLMYRLKPFPEKSDSGS